MQFVDVLIRQAHPGPGAEPYRDFPQKLRDAERWKDEDGIPYTVAADDLEGTVHQTYGGLADPTYLIDSEGRVVFYNMWTHAPTLHRAIEELLAGGVPAGGVVLGGVDRTPHMAAAMTNGWKGLRRGLPQSLIDIETAFPTSGLMPLLGYQMRAVLAPVTLRAKPLPAAAKVALAVGAGALLAGIVLAARRRRDA